ncbi:ABC-type transport auxiliary lipoprotein family protein [Hydrogenimonas urashimensis]|uniref:ABC-type transport auxiliary lipoprotein family protein n=1 Tax=Hydrogenimonas urashimensis TaxID=2740515 RepID=UPI001915FB53|nr:ABC-type transport auxiliary lipoprotein family protein [Hydrogenimonas urashimensis]
MKFFIPLILLLLGGCAVKEVPPAQSYTIAPETPGLEKRALEKPVWRTLEILVKQNGRTTATRNIYYLTKNYRLQPYAYSIWYDTVGTMLQNKLLTAFKEANIAQTVSDGLSSLRPEAMLQIQLLAFCQDFSSKGPSTATVRLLATFHSDKKSVSRIFTAETPAPTDDAEGGVKAFNEALDAITKDLVGWVATIRP